MNLSITASLIAGHHHKTIFEIDNRAFIRLLMRSKRLMILCDIIYGANYEVLERINALVWTCLRLSFKFAI